MSKYYSPLRYPGGKNCIFPFVSDLIYKNGLKGAPYAEPFAGGAGLALHLLMEGYVSEIHLNDLDFSIYSFWHTILNDTLDFCEWIRDVDINIDTWNWARNVHNHMKDYDMSEIGRATFFLNRTNISGIIMGGPLGGPSQTGKYKLNARFNKDELITRIINIVKFKKSIYLYNLDGKDFLRLINRKHKNFFIYIDPPYVKKGADLYMNFFDNEQHIILREQIKRMRKHWIISYDDCDLINKLYSNYVRYRYSLSQCTSNRVGKELIITDPKLDIIPSINKLANPTNIPN